MHSAKATICFLQADYGTGEEACLKESMRPLTIKTAAKHREVSLLLRDNSINYAVWIGLLYNPSLAKWQWYDLVNLSPTLRKWAPGHGYKSPSDRSYDCASISGADYLFYQANCVATSDVRPIVCENDPNLKE